VSDLAEQAAGRVDDAAGWLERHEPGEVLDSVRGLARRRPGAFLAGAALLGVLAGRLTRGAVDANRDTGGSSSGYDHLPPARGVPQPPYGAPTPYGPGGGAVPPPVPPPPPHAPGGYPGQAYPAGPQTTVPPLPPTAPPAAPPPQGPPRQSPPGVPPVTQTAPPPVDPPRPVPPEARTGELFSDDLRREGGYDDPGGPR
jgi:hypothetical protein